MKKIFTILSIVLLGAISCTKSNLETPSPVAEDSGLVEVNMTMTLPNWLMAETKAGGVMAHKPDIDNIRVAMFGTSGYPQAYTKATLTGTAPTENNTTYTFTVLLPVYEGEAHVHIIANGPDSILYDGWPENKLMAKMTTEGGVGAYWARIVLEDGLLAQWTGNGTMQTNDNHNFVPTEETAAKFRNITLIRNFAEVRLVEINGLTDVTYTLVNVPTSGSVAPIFGDSVRSEPKSATDTTTLYYADYLDDYAAYKYNTTSEKMEKGSTAYDGYMVNQTIDSSLPASGAALPAVVNDSIPAFVYERTVATENTTALLIRGKYSDNNYYYYRLDLLGATQPLALYRNYQYRIRIGRLGNKGYSSPTEAMKHNSSDNISAMVEAKTLTDISDGAARLYVEFIEKNYVSSGQKEFWVKYVPDVSDKNTDGSEKVDNSKVVIKDLKGNAITSAITAGRTAGDYQYYTFTTDGQGTSDKVSTFVVEANNGKTGDFASKLTRTVTVRVVKSINTTLTMNPEDVSNVAGAKTILNIALSDTLQSSMFPLEIYIEDTNHTLNPTGTDGAGNALTVPVKIGKSLKDNTTNSFYFVRTVNWSEYEPMRDAYKAGNTGAIVFHTEFKTLVDESETMVYVDNEYFSVDSVKLTTHEATRYTDSFTFYPSMFATASGGNPADLTETSTDGHVTLTFSRIASVTDNYVQLVNGNNTATATFSTDASKTKVTRVSMNFTSYDNSRGNITASTGGGVSNAVETSPYTRRWPATGTASSNNLVLTFTRASEWDWGWTYYYHYITSITVEYEYYE